MHEFISRLKLALFNKDPLKDPAWTVKKSTHVAYIREGCMYVDKSLVAHDYRMASAESQAINYLLKASVSRVVDALLSQAAKKPTDSWRKTRNAIAYTYAALGATKIAAKIKKLENPVNPEDRPGKSGRRSRRKDVSDPEFQLLLDNRLAAKDADGANLLVLCRHLGIRPSDAISVQFLRRIADEIVVVLPPGKQTERGEITSVIPAGNIIVPTRMALGKVAINKVAMAINQDLKALIVKDRGQVHKPYLFRFLESQSKFIERQGKGATVKGITLDILNDLKVPVPSMPEQKRIAAILDKADAIRRKRQQAIQLADEFLRAVFLDMFGDPVTNPKGWDVKTVAECIADGEVLQVQDGNHGNDHPKVADFVPSGIPFITANVVRRGQILFDQCYYLGNEWLEKLRIGFAKPRDVLISHKGSLGFTAVLDDSFDTYIFSPQTTYYRVNENRLISEYLKGYFDTSYFQRLFEKEGIQSTRAYLGITRQKDLPIVLPDIQLQKKFSELVSRHKALKETAYRQRESLSDSFHALSQKAFSGNL